MSLYNVDDNSMPTVTMVAKRKLAIGHEIYYRGLIPVRGIRFCFCHLVHTGSGAHPASYPIDIEAPFHGASATASSDLCFEDPELKSWRRGRLPWQRIFAEFPLHVMEPNS
jgi:hypothetical protein